MLSGWLGSKARTARDHRSSPVGSLSEVHALAAQIALVLAVLTAALAILGALRGRGPGAFFQAGVLWTGFVLVGAAALGIGVALADGFPQDPLHVIYGALAAGTLPGAAIVAGRRTGQGQSVVWAIAGIVLVILVLRLYQTAG
jgi:hypothetical protein